MSDEALRARADLAMAEVKDVLQKHRCVLIPTVTIIGTSITPNFLIRALPEGTGDGNVPASDSE